jgi:hypothetical protein
MCELSLRDDNSRRVVNHNDDDKMQRLRSRASINYPDGNI